MGCATTSLSTQNRIPVATEQGKAAQPILYLDVEGDKFVFRGVYVDGTRVTLRIANYEPLPMMPMWSPDGKWFAYITGDRTSGRVNLELGDLRGGIKTIFTLENASVITQPIWSPDGRKIVVGLFEQPNSVLSVIVADLEDEKMRSRYELPLKFEDRSPGPQVRPSFRWSPDGQKILIAVGAGAFVIDPLKRVVDTLANAPILAEWVPDSDGVYFFEVLDRSAPKDKGVVMAQDQDNLGNFYFKPLGPSKPIKLMDKEQIKTLRLANLGALFYGNT